MSIDELDFKICLKVSDIPVEILQQIIRHNLYDSEMPPNILKDILNSSTIEILDLYWDI